MPDLAPAVDEGVDEGVDRREPPTGEGALAIEVIGDVAGLAALKIDWERLETLDPACTPFNTWLWASLWWRHYGAGHALHVVVLRAERGRRGTPGAIGGTGGDGAEDVAGGGAVAGDVVAIAPLQRRRERAAGGLPVTTLRWLGSGGDTSPDYLNLVAEPAARDRAERAVLAHVMEAPGWQRLHLSDVPVPSGLARVLDAGLRDARGLALDGRVNMIHVDDLPSSWEDYRLALGRKRRKQINHRRNRLDAAGDSALGIARTPAELAEATEALIRLHRERWASKGEPGGFASDAYVGFHRDVIAGFFARDALWLATLRLDGEIIGVQYVFRWRDTLQFFQSGYSPAHDSLSPGHVLFTFVIGEGIARGLARVDMLKGDYGYKTAYARRSRLTRDFLFVRPGPHAVLARARSAARRVRTRLSRSVPDPRT